MKKTKKISIQLIMTIGVVVIAVGFLLFIVWYLLVAVPEQKRQTELNQARNRATAECQTMLDKSRADYSKASSLVEQMRAKGFGYMINADFKQIEENWTYVNTPSWFQGCITRNMVNYGY